MLITTRCQCLPIYNPTPKTPKCPPGCLQAASVIYSFEEGLGCEDSVVINLEELTNPGSCTCGVTFSVLDGNIDAVIVGSTLTITNNEVNPALVGTLLYVDYLMTCDCDVRSISGRIQVPITEVCPD